MDVQCSYNPPTMVRLNSAQRTECINWRANAKAKAELQNRIKTITRDMKTDLKNWMETHHDSEPDTLELVVKCIDYSYCKADCAPCSSLFPGSPTKLALQRFGGESEGRRRLYGAERHPMRPPCRTRQQREKSIQRSRSFEQREKRKSKRKKKQKRKRKRKKILSTLNSK